jgi:hypothetical protein
VAITLRRRRGWAELRRLTAWIGLLALAQTTDVVTTAADLARGGVEANAVVQTLLGVGGLGLVLGLKLALVGAMAMASLLVQLYVIRHPGSSAARAQVFVWRSLQVSVVGLILVAVHNLALLAVIG